MSDKKYDNSGLISRNPDKSEPGAGENWPDYKGYCTVNGADYWISGWKKDGSRGPFLSLAFKRKESKEDATSAKQKQKEPEQEEFVDDDIPF